MNTLALPHMVKGLVIGELYFLLMLAIVPLQVRAEIPFVWIGAVLSPLCVVLFLYCIMYIGRYVATSLQIATFVLIGVLNTLVDIGALNILILFSTSTTIITLSIFKAFSFIVAVTNSYFWNKYWTFNGASAGTKKGSLEFLQFMVVSVGGLFINVSVFAITHFLLSSNVEAISLSVIATTSALVAALGSLVWNFVGYKFFVFATS